MRVRQGSPFAIHLRVCCLCSHRVGPSISSHLSGARESCPSCQKHATLSFIYGNWSLNCGDGSPRGRGHAPPRQKYQTQGRSGFLTSWCVWFVFPHSTQGRTERLRNSGSKRFDPLPSTVRVPRALHNRIVGCRARCSRMWCGFRNVARAKPYTYSTEPHAPERTARDPGAATRL